MEIHCWIHSWDGSSDANRNALIEALAQQGVKVAPFDAKTSSLTGILLFAKTTPDLQSFVQIASQAGKIRVIGIGDLKTSTSGHWKLLQSGASDILTWSDAERAARQIKARIDRWFALDELMDQPMVSELVIAKSPTLRATLRDLVEVARFSEGNILLLGESGTGKEVAARLVHLLDPRANKRDLVVLDCASIVPELSGSEFFGHERGAFTGALTDRQGAFSLANGGTLFLDEVGELPLPLQAQLLRVIQERTFKRVGGNTWAKTAFRLVCATNRDLLDLVHRGAFRADLYYRIAGYVCRLPPLRERPEDIIPLAEHFLRLASPNRLPPTLDESVRDFLMQRDYPGNVRDLQQVVSQFVHRASADGSVTVGCVPAAQRPVVELDKSGWLDSCFEQPIHRAVLLGAALKEISRAAEDAAIRFVTNEEDGNLQRAARRLGVTDRALQLRRANGRHSD
ncbi:sigma-54-dependent transcriptional regulator [Methylocapsa palsarum]|uniref:Sigma-54 interaction domain-containing protein n=1 Tax=Methylocapsa palsarum TaxID=1612308 RepID=A0A1I4ASL7_9HYPH|nr:sigma 54-interacting transcriptional regulator [Methylocapsa palsarum]SFK58947.1 Sigma-54 interaction domain-containing protein [Methylocapsa palsarum]